MHWYYVIYASAVAPVCTLVYRLYALKRTKDDEISKTIAALNKPSIIIRLGRRIAVEVEQDVSPSIPPPRAVRSRQKSA